MSVALTQPRILLMCGFADNASSEPTGRVTQKWVGLVERGSGVAQIVCLNRLHLLAHGRIRMLRRMHGQARVALLARGQIQRRVRLRRVILRRVVQGRDPQRRVIRRLTQRMVEALRMPMNQAHRRRHGMRLAHIFEKSD